MTKYVVGTAVAVLGILGVLYFVYPEAISSMWPCIQSLYQLKVHVVESKEQLDVAC